MRLIISHLRREMTPQGVRRIPINVRSLTGEVDGHQFESSLERDAMLLAHWDYYVEWYQSQPVTIEYQDKERCKRRYTPDLLLMYRTDICLPGQQLPRRPLLCEIKYRSDLAMNWMALKPKFIAARKYAKERNWDFRIWTEREIRMAYLKNIQFLWSYRFAEFHAHHYRCLLDTLNILEETDPKTLLEATYQSETMRGEALWTLWCMVARRWIGCDLSLPLTMETRIWIGE
jgi:hypothetical protein